MLLWVPLEQISKQIDWWDMMLQIGAIVMPITITAANLNLEVLLAPKYRTKSLAKVFFSFYTSN